MLAGGVVAFDLQGVGESLNGGFGVEISECVGGCDADGRFDVPECRDRQGLGFIRLTAIVGGGLQGEDAGVGILVGALNLFDRAEAGGDFFVRDVAGSVEANRGRDVDVLAEGLELLEGMIGAEPGGGSGEIDLDLQIALVGEGAIDFGEGGVIVHGCKLSCSEAADFSVGIAEGNDQRLVGKRNLMALQTGCEGLDRGVGLRSVRVRVGLQAVAEKDAAARTVAAANALKRNGEGIKLDSFL